MLSLAVAVAAMTSCNKDDVTEWKQVASDAKRVYYFWGYTIGTSGTDFPPKVVQDGDYAPIQGVVLTLEQGRTFTSDANGKMTVTLPAGNYLGRFEYPEPWRTGVKYPTGGSPYTYVLEDKYVYKANEWDSFNFTGPNVSVSEEFLYKN